MTLVCHSSIYKLGQLSSHTTLHCVAVGSNTNSAMGSNTNSAMGSNTNSAMGSNTNSAMGSNTNSAMGSNTNSAMGSNTNSAMGSNTNSAISAQFTSSPYVRLMITFITDENVMVDETSANTETVFTKHSPQH